MNGESKDNNSTLLRHRSDNLLLSVHLVSSTGPLVSRLRFVHIFLSVPSVSVERSGGGQLGSVY